MYPNQPAIAWAPVPRPQAQPAKSKPSLLLAVAEADVPRFTLPSFTRLVTATTADTVTLLARERPTALVLDADLPTLDAVAICRGASAQETTSVLVTMLSPDRAPAMLKAGCHAILLKPFAPNLLAARLGRLTRERDQQLRLRGLRRFIAPDQCGTNRSWPDVSCPRCQAPNATSFEFSSYRRMWFACLTCDHVWLGVRRE